jgi:hypothetical protein
MNNITALLLELAKAVTPALLIVLAIQQWWAKRSADKRGLAVQEGINKAQSAATEAAEKAAQVARRAEHIAEKTEDVRQTLVQTDSVMSTKVDHLKTQGEQIHTLVNSNMGLQLKSTAMYARRVADLTGDAKDIQLAEEHERLLQVHEAKQKQVDDKQIESS